MTIEHEFRETDDRCKHCGVPRATHEATPEQCIRSHSATTVLRPEPEERQYAVYDAGTISARLAELKAEREAVWSQTEEPSV